MVSVVEAVDNVDEAVENVGEVVENVGLDFVAVNSEEDLVEMKIKLVVDKGKNREEALDVDLVEVAVVKNQWEVSRAVKDKITF